MGDSEREALAAMEVPLNATQLRAVAQMRAELAAELAEAPDFPEVVGDLRLLRFLRGHKFHMPTAVTMFRNMLAWRKTSGVDAIRQAVADGLPAEQFPHRERILRVYPVNPSHRESRDGRPVSIELTGRVRPRELLSAVSLPDFLQFHMHCMEALQLQLERLSHERGVQMRAVVIKDLNGLGRAHAWKPGIDFLREVISITQDSYPECVHKVYLISAPWAFYALWRVIKPLLAERTVSKVVILDDRYEEALKEAVAEDSLPVFFGGSCSCEGGCIPFIDDKGEEMPAAAAAAAAAADTHPQPQHQRSRRASSSAVRLAAMVGVPTDVGGAGDAAAGGGDGDDDEEAARRRARARHPVARVLGATVLWPLCFAAPYVAAAHLLPATSLVSLLVGRAVLHVLTTTSTIAFLLRQVTPLSRAASVTAITLAGCASAVLVAVAATWACVVTSYELAALPAADGGDADFAQWDEAVTERVERLLAASMAGFALLLVGALLYGNEWGVRVSYS